jgi:DEAD/DEAH box helicase domain-containing protein
MTHSFLVAELSTPLSEDIRLALERVRGVKSFYTHQAKAIDAILDNKHVIVSTSTASGKSLVYQVCCLVT